MRHHNKSRALACALLAACAAAFAFGAAGSFAQVRAEPNAAEFVSVAELREKLSKNEPVTLIDLRSANVFASSDGKIAGAVHIKERRLRARLAQPPLRNLPRDTEVVTYCACPNDEAAVRAAQTLSSAGFTRVRVLKGGWRAWLDARAPVESKPKGQ